MQNNFYIYMYVKLGFFIKKKKKKEKKEIKYIYYWGL